MTDDQRATIFSLFDQGYSRREIAERVGLAHSTVAKKIYYYTHPEAKRAKKKRASGPRRCKPWRCPDCNALLEITECIACRDRKSMGVTH